jgi:hypothetical protein
MTDVDLSTSRESKSHHPRRSVGDVVTLANDVVVPIGYAFIVPAGAKATIIDIDDENGDIVVQLHGTFPELAHRRNVTCFSAADAEIDLA